MRLLPVFALLVAIVAACGPAANAPTATPEIPTPQGQVVIENPANGSIIYAETLTVSGTASDLPDDTFRLILRAPDDTVVTEADVTVIDNRWQTEFVHEHEGDPAEMMLIAAPTDATITGDYDIVSLVVSPLENRPDGTFGTIISPQEGQSTGGDIIAVAGTASGLFEGTLIIRLLNEDDAIISENIITVTNPGIVDDVPWSAEITTEGYTGPATLTIGYTDAQDGDDVIIDQVDFTVTNTAG